LDSLGQKSSPTKKFTKYENKIKKSPMAEETREKETEQN
jgi:hypothetical protein